MVFGGSTKSRFQRLSLPSKNTATSILTSSFDSDNDDDDNYDSSTLNLIITSDAGRKSAYNFDDLKCRLEEPYSFSNRPMMMLPIPLPCIAPSTTRDLDDIIDHNCDGNDDDDISPQNSNSVRFRWNGLRSQFSSSIKAEAVIVDQENLVSADDSDHQYTMKPFFLCSTQSTSNNTTPMMADIQYNNFMEGYDCNDHTSLLHGRTVSKSSKCYKTSENTRTSTDSKAAAASISTQLKSSKKTNQSTTGIDQQEQYTSLLPDTNFACHDWVHRQLAFDLEYLEQHNDGTNPIFNEEFYHFNDEEPHWALHPDEIGFEIPPPPPPPPTTPPLIRSRKLRKKARAKNNERLFSDERFMKLDDSDESPTLLEEILQSKSHFEKSTPTTDVFVFDLQQKESWQEFNAEKINGSTNRSNHKQSYQKSTPIVRSRFGRYSHMTPVDIQRRPRPSRHGGGRRRRSGRRSPPKLLGRQFATNLATVTERPSEEEANSSCIPTPMSTKNRHFFTKYESDTSSNESSNESGEGTAETGSSKDS